MNERKMVNLFLLDRHRLVHLPKYFRLMSILVTNDDYYFHRRKD